MTACFAEIKMELAICSTVAQRHSRKYSRHSAVVPNVSTYCADDMETALLGLQSIEECEVSRTPAGSAGQHVWAITFLEVTP